MNSPPFIAFVGKQDNNSKSTIKPKVKRDSRFPEILTSAGVIFGIALGITSFARDCIQESTLKDVRFKQSAAEHRPILQAEIPDTGKPFHVNVKAAKKDMIDISKSHSEKAAISVSRIISARLPIDLTNVGAVPAKVYFYMCGDTTSYYAKLRSMMLADNAAADSNIIIRYNDRPIEILAGKKNQVIFDNRIYFIESDQFTLHMLALYSNGFGNFYDTYVCARYDAPLGTMKLLTNRLTGGIAVNSDSLILGISLHEEPVITYHTYNHSESAKINKLLTAYGLPAEE